VVETYNDLGATIAGRQQDLNLDITNYVNGVEMSPVQIDTSQVATDTIDYIATDQNGLTSASTRTVIIERAKADITRVVHEEPAFVELKASAALFGDLVNFEQTHSNNARQVPRVVGSRGVTQWQYRRMTSTRNIRVTPHTVWKWCLRYQIRNFLPFNTTWRPNGLS
jgi:hypothetical protein